MNSTTNEITGFAYCNLKKLIVVNELSGQNMAKNTYNRYLKYNCNHEKNDKVVTIKDKESDNLTDSLLCDDYDVIIILGGDGTVSSVVNIMMKCNIKKPVSVMPCGTGNGLCKSLLYSNDIDYNIENVVKKTTSTSDDGMPHGKRKLDRLDVFKVINSKGDIDYGFLSLTWGIFANIDIKTEWLRRLGSFRNKLGALWELIVKKSYKGKLTYVDEDGVWRSLTDDFYYFTASNVSHVCHDVFINPDIKLNDKLFHIGYLSGKKTSRYNILKLLLSFDSGTCDKYLKTIKTNHFILEPESGILVLDGEQISLQKIEMKFDGDNISIF